MSFKIDWCFSERTTLFIKEKIYSLLNESDQKPDEIFGDISIEHLSFGRQPPTVALTEVESISDDLIVIQASAAYNGDFEITLKTKAQINPLYATNVESEDEDEEEEGNEEMSESLLRSEAMSTENRPFVVPVSLSLSHLEFNGNFRLSIDIQNRVVDFEWIPPADSIDDAAEPSFCIKVSSTFDDASVVKNYLQSLIEDKIKSFLTEDLPLLVHDLSESYFESSESTNPQNSLSVFNSISKERENFLAASYSTPEGIFLVDRRLLSPFTQPDEFHKRIQQRMAEESAAKNAKNKLICKGPVLVSFPFKSSMCHVLSSFNTSMLMQKYQNVLFPMSSVSAKSKKTV